MSWGPSRPQARILCFPHAGAGPSAFHAWLPQLAPSVGLFAAQLPGRQTRIAEAPLTDFDRVMDGVTEAFSQLLDRPYVVFGHSLGGLFAFEFARRVVARSWPRPRHVFVSAIGPPERPLSRPSVATMSDDAFVAAVLSLNGTEPGLFTDPEMRALMLPPLRADFLVHESYAYRPTLPLDVPLSVLYGLQDTGTTPEVLAGWSAQTTAGFDLRGFPGDHFFAVSPPAPVAPFVQAALGEPGDG